MPLNTCRLCDEILGIGPHVCRPKSRGRIAVEIPEKISEENLDVVAGVNNKTLHINAASSKRPSQRALGCSGENPHRRERQCASVSRISNSERIPAPDKSPRDVASRDRRDYS